MSDFTVSVLVPVLNRPQNVDRFLTSFFKTSPSEKTELLFITGIDCQEEIDTIKKFDQSIEVAIAPSHVVSWAKRINWGVDYSKTKTKFSPPSSWVLCCADDVVFDDDWFSVAEEAAKDFSGILGTNDLGHPATIGGWHSTHPLVSRNYIETMGTMDEVGKLCHEGYDHNYVDVEFIHTAMKRGKWKHEPKCIIEHMHPAWNKGVNDAVYDKGQRNVSADSRLWASRKNRFNL